MGFMDLFRGSRIKASNMDAAANEAARKLYRQFLPKVLDAAGDISKTLDKLADEHGMDRDYVWFVFSRSSRWPSAGLSSADKTRLHVAQDIIVRAGDLPNYAQMQMPSVEADLTMDMLFMSLSTWIERTLTKKLTSEYTKIGWLLAGPYADVLSTPGDSAPPRMQAAGMINGYLKNLLLTVRFTETHRLLVSAVVHELLKA